VERNDLEQFDTVVMASDTRNAKEEIWQLRKEIKMLLSVPLIVSGILTIVMLLLA